MDDEERKGFISRIGTFFLLLGLAVVILFIASDIGQQTAFSYFFIGIILFSIGFVFKRMSAPSPKPSNRFEGIRRLQQQRREAKAKKEAQKKDAKKKK
jgi:predicted membrane channel-forming protein YqfA (hemolysin III family)